MSARKRTSLEALFAAEELPAAVPLKQNRKARGNHHFVAFLKKGFILTIHSPIRHHRPSRVVFGTCFPFLPER